MDIRQLRVFRAILQTGSVSAAARALSISQPAVSKTLASIEDEMDLRLFERINGRLVPTPQAHALCPDIDRILADFALVKQTARELRTGHRGRITIATAPTASASLIPPAIVAFRRSHPLVEFSVTATTTRGVIEMVARNEVEIGVCQPNSGERSVRATALCNGAVICLMPADHELRRRKQVSPADLAECDLISFPLSEPTGVRIAEAFKNEGLLIRLTAEVNQSFTACTMVMAGVGLALVDSFLPTASSFPNIVARPFTPTIELRVQLMTSSSRILSPLALAFRDQLMISAKNWERARW